MKQVSQEWAHWVKILGKIALVLMFCTLYTNSVNAETAKEQTQRCLGSWHQCKINKGCDETKQTRAEYVNCTRPCNDAYHTCNH